MKGAEFRHHYCYKMDSGVSSRETTEVVMSGDSLEMQRNDLPLTCYSYCCSYSVNKQTEKLKTQYSNQNIFCTHSQNSIIIKCCTNLLI